MFRTADDLHSPSVGLPQVNRLLTGGARMMQVLIRNDSSMNINAARPYAGVFHLVTSELESCSG